MSYDINRLYGLLPAWHRLRDTELGQQLVSAEEQQHIAQLRQQLASLGDPGSEEALLLQDLIDQRQRGPLKALMSIIAEQVAVLEENMDQLYDDQFIETCAEWVVPYIGELVGTRGLLSLPDASFSQRAQVANTISYRRRKGTAAVLEQIARDITGWDARVVEYFQLLATTQYLNHLRPENLSIVSLRDWEGLQRLNTPWDKMAHTVDVRSVDRRRGKYNIPSIGIFLWRLDRFPLLNSPAYAVDDKRYMFDALGKDTRLYNLPVEVEEIVHPAEPADVTMPFSRRILAAYLPHYYGKDKSITIYRNGVIVPESDVSVCRLDDVLDGSGNPTGAWINTPSSGVSLDPVLGRLSFAVSPAADGPIPVRVSYYHGFSAAMGGGQYGRSDSFTPDLLPLIRVPEDRPGIQAAMDALSGSGGVVEIDSDDYFFETPVIKLAAGIKVELRAADKRRPVIVSRGDWMITGGANAILILNGLFVSGGGLRLPAQDGMGQPNLLHSMQLLHCTLAPGASPAIGPAGAEADRPRLLVAATDVQVQIDQSILGAVRADRVAVLRITNSIVDSGSGSGLAYGGTVPGEPGAALTIKNSTVIGRVYAQIMVLASNVIFMAEAAPAEPSPLPVQCEQVQEGCVRYSYVPPGSKTPRRYHCQPADAATGVRPVFTSLRYGDAGYCQLHRCVPPAISKGADDEAEMGVFHNLFQPQREANLRARLDEYLPFSCQAGIFYAS